jgi:hypothetical protein
MDCMVQTAEACSQLSGIITLEVLREVHEEDRRVVNNERPHAGDAVAQAQHSAPQAGSDERHQPRMH